LVAQHLGDVKSSPIFEMNDVGGTSAIYEAGQVDDDYVGGAVPYKPLKPVD